MLKTAWTTTDITPEVGMPLCGFARPDGRPGSALRDPILAHSLLLADDTQAIVLVSVDWCGIRLPSLYELRRAVDAVWPLDLPVTVHVACTHTHSGPDTLALFGFAEDEPVLSDWLRAIAADIAVAAGDLQPASCSVAQSAVPLNHNRRAPGLEHKLSMRHEPGVTTGVTDPTMVLLRIARPDDSEILLWNYTAHPVCLNGASDVISADYPGEVRRLLNDAQPGRTTFFLNGAAANIHLHDCIYPDDRAVVGMGAKLADAITTLYSSLQPMPADSLAQAQRTLTFPNRHDDTLQFDVELNVLRIGDLPLLVVPGEYFVEFQIEWRAELDQIGMMIGYANGWPGYIPPLDAYPIGGYGVDLSNDPPTLSRSRMPAGGGEKILDTLRQLSAQTGG